MRAWPADTCRRLGAVDAGRHLLPGVCDWAHTELRLVQRGCGAGNRRCRVPPSQRAGGCADTVAAHIHSAWPCSQPGIAGTLPACCLAAAVHQAFLLRIACSSPALRPAPMPTILRIACPHTGALERQYEALIRRACEAVIVAALHPRALIQVVVQVSWQVVGCGHKAGRAWHHPACAMDWRLACIADVPSLSTILC